MNTMLDFSANAANQDRNEVFVAQRSIQIEPDRSATALFYGIGLAGLVGLVLFLFNSTFPIGFRVIQKRGFPGVSGAVSPNGGAQIFPLYSERWG